MKRPVVDSAALKAAVVTTLAGWVRSPAWLIAGAAVAAFVALWWFAFLLGAWG